jgi:hypothetical protein
MSGHEEPRLRSATELWLSVRASLFAAKYEMDAACRSESGPRF